MTKLAHAFRKAVIPPFRTLSLSVLRLIDPKHGKRRRYNRMMARIRGEDPYRIK